MMQAMDADMAVIREGGTADYVESVQQEDILMEGDAGQMEEGIAEQNPDHEPESVEDGFFS